MDLADWTTTSTCQPHPQFIKYHYRTSFARFYQHCANIDLSILNGESKNPGIVTIKKLCDGVGITLGEFFSTESFNNLEQEIQ